MIRSLMTVLVLSMGSFSFAQAECDTKLKLTCEATYKAEYQAFETLTMSDSFADENWDEPSLANCAATVYFNTGDTSVRVYASKDLASDAVKAESVASQVENEGNIRKGFYSNTTSATSAVGGALNLGTLILPKPFANGVSEVSVKCTVK